MYENHENHLFIYKNHDFIYTNHDFMNKNHDFHVTNHDGYLRTSISLSSYLLSGARAGRSREADLYIDIYI